MFETHIYIIFKYVVYMYVYEVYGYESHMTSYVQLLGISENITLGRNLRFHRHCDNNYAMFLV